MAGKAASVYWGSDIVIAGGRVSVPKTGAEFALDRQLVADALTWFVYYGLVTLGAAWVRLTRPVGPRIWFSPDQPRPWYVIRAATAWSGARLARSIEDADAVFHFEDSTWSAPPEPAMAFAFNARCRDVSKTHVAEVFESVFGYPLAVDPTTWGEPAVVKSELNGRHDGRILECPRPRAAGYSYQRLIETAENGFVHDLRTSCVQGRPVVVLHKTRPSDIRFSIQSTTVRARAPEAVFSTEELDQISRFAQAMNLDWGSLDILRERSTGQIYVVDANKTEVGPPVALSWKDKILVTRVLATAVSELVTSRLHHPMVRARS